MTVTDNHVLQKKKEMASNIEESATRRRIVLLLNYIGLFCSTLYIPVFSVLVLSYYFPHKYTSNYMHTYTHKSTYDRVHLFKGFWVYTLCKTRLCFTSTRFILQRSALGYILIALRPTFSLAHLLRLPQDIQGYVHQVK
jgi:hypothetical protein